MRPGDFSSLPGGLGNKRRLNVTVQKSRFRIAFMGSIPLAVECLRYLSKLEGVEIAAVVTSPRGKPYWWSPPYVIDVAGELGIKVVAQEELYGQYLDAIIVVGYDRILKSKIINIPKKGVINLHLAPLPEYRGCNGHAHAIINGETGYGVTLHYIDEGIDTGPIIARNDFAIPPDSTARELYELSEKVALDMFRQRIPEIISGKVKATSQGEGKYYYHQDSLVDNEVDIHWEPQRIYNFVRAMTFYPFEKPYIRFGDRKIYLSVK
jgi:methionyl-tRNA formyltransferase